MMLKGGYTFETEKYSVALPYKEGQPDERVLGPMKPVPCVLACIYGSGKPECPYHPSFCGMRNTLWAPSPLFAIAWANAPIFRLLPFSKRPLRTVVQ